MSFHFDTGFPADSLEFCPNPRAADILVCGTYRLIENQPQIAPRAPQVRRGQCLVLQVQNSDNPLTDGIKPHLIQSLDFPAIPDMKWCHRQSMESAILGIADSEGSITICEWQEDEQFLKQIASIRCASPDTLCLSLDWSNRVTGGTQLGSLVVSLSNGFLAHLQPSETGSLQLIDSWHAHDYEPWTSAWNYHDANIIYSGGDDLKMKAWDIRQGFGQPLFVNTRFEAGVTCIQSHPFSQNLIAVGSYDSYVRLFDPRKPLVPVKELFVGGGLWRVKWHPTAMRKDDLLLACMHDGFKVANFSDTGGAGARITKEFKDHESLAYGVDWSFAELSESDKSLIGSCSFYDHRLQIWSG